MRLRLTVLERVGADKYRATLEGDDQSSTSFTFDVLEGDIQVVQASREFYGFMGFNTQQLVAAILAFHRAQCIEPP